MKRNLILIFFSIIGFFNAQYLVEDFDTTENVSEFGVARIGFSLNQKMEHYKLPCEKPTYARFSNGEEGFKKELHKNMQAYLDSGQYAVNGAFYLYLTIDSAGKIGNISVSPSVQNSEMLSKDIEFAVRKIKTNWIPATCNRQPVDSKVRLKIIFGTEDFDR